ncbi:hypothetical protein BC830DRAFT_1170261 [Chytriomyces sp. MP71]|nr:hypothetical protein BC830DRAFT_1170261 [Chytriomyces sp. MP71]
MLTDNDVFSFSCLGQLEPMLSRLLTPRLCPAKLCSPVRQQAAPRRTLQCARFASSAPTVARRGGGRKPRSVRDTAPDPFEAEQKLLQTHLVRAHQSASARSASSTDAARGHESGDGHPEQRPQRSPRRRKLNHAKLHLLSGHEKIALLRQLLAGGPSYLADADAVYSLLSKNGLLDRLRFIDFHNLFRLLGGRDECRTHRGFLLRAWRDWGRVVAGEHGDPAGVYTPASYAVMIRIAALWADRELARELWGHVLGQKLTSALGIESYHHLLALFSGKLRSNTADSEGGSAKQPLVVVPATSADLQLARQILETLSRPGTPLKTLKTIIYSIEIAGHALEGEDSSATLSRLTAAYDAALSFVELLPTASPEKTHAAMQVTTSSLYAFHENGFTTHATAIVNTLPATVVPLVQPHFEIASTSSRDVTDSSMLDMLRKDATRILTASLKVLAESPNPRVHLALAAELRETLQRSVGCKLEDACLRALATLYARAMEWEAAREWHARAVQFHSARAAVGTRIALMRVAAEQVRADRIWIWEEYVGFLELVLELVEETVGLDGRRNRVFDAISAEALAGLQLVGEQEKVLMMDETLLVRLKAAREATI